MLSKTKKAEILKDLKEKIARQKTMVFVDFTGLKVKDFSNLRKKLKAAGNELKVAKKTLMGIVFKEAKLEAEIKKLPGEVALVFGYQDVVSPAKIVYQFAEANPNLKILGGFLENKIRTAEEIVVLAQIPSKEELLAKFVQLLLSHHKVLLLFSFHRSCCLDTSMDAVAHENEQIKKYQMQGFSANLNLKSFYFFCP